MKHTETLISPPAITPRIAPRSPANLQATSAWLNEFMPLPKATLKAINKFEATVRTEVEALGNPLALHGMQLVRLKQRLAHLDCSSVPPGSSFSADRFSSMEAKLKQFVLGSINLDCRDSASIGHGVAIAQFASPMTAGYWCDCMKEGLLVGAAATEPQGGTSKHRFVTRMQCGPSGWRLFGRKVSISRLHEAGVFVVYAQAAAGLTAVAIDANASRIRRTERKPAGLQGWSWGVLEFQGTPFRPSDILGSPGDGHRVFAAHFSAFRPLVASTALGAAAAAWSIVQRDLRERLAAGQIARPRDTALELIAYHKTQIRNALLGVLTSSGGMAAATPEDEEAVMCAKADGVETALEAVRDLRVLVSAEKSMIAGEVFDKTLRDLEAYRFADGLNGELWRAAGKRLLA